MRNEEDTRLLVQSDLTGVTQILAVMENHADPDGRRNRFHRGNCHMTSQPAFRT